MNYYELVTNENVYKLRLNTRSVIKLEKLLGGNPLKVFADLTEENLPTVETMASILYASLLAYNEKMTLEKAYDIFDEWLESGHMIAEFVAVIVDLYKGAGIIQKDKAEKN